MVSIESTNEIASLTPNEYVPDLWYGFEQLEPCWLFPLKLLAPLCGIIIP